MSVTLRVLYAGAFAAMFLAPATAIAQASPATTKSAVKDSLAIPRQFVKWVFAKQGDSAYAQAGPQLRETMKSAEGVNDLASRIQTRFGEQNGTDTEVQFDEGPLKVYIAVMRFSQAPEPGAFMVTYSPTTKVVERAGFTSLSNIKTRFPQAKLP